MNLLEKIGSILNPVRDLISEAIPDKDKRNEIVGALYSAEQELNATLVREQSANIRAEATGESWIQRNWRPITMLTFVSLIVCRWLGWAAPGISEAVELELMSLVQIGLGGYVVGRSAEKIAPHLKGMFRKN